MYNADQLRATCQQYIAINLAALLEARYVQRRSAESHLSAVYSHQPGSLTGGKVSQENSVEPCHFMGLVILQKGSYLLDIELFWLSENNY